MTRGFRSFAAVLALTAIMLRALLPDGWMPSFADTTGTSVIICTLDGIQHVLIGPDGEPINAPPDQHDQSCHFIAAASLAPLTSALAFSLPADTGTLVRSVKLHLVARPAPPLDSRAARPPPHLA
jgi:hypothetical protein